eukprot:29567-Prymnesium_polylepis.3
MTDRQGVICLLAAAAPCRDERRARSQPARVGASAVKGALGMHAATLRTNTTLGVRTSTSRPQSCMY